MKKELPVRKKIRLKGNDYASPGYYFITICCKDREKLLWINKPDVGAIINRPQVELSKYGQITENAIHEIEKHYRRVTVDKYVIMPNHVHMILIIHSDKDGRLIIASTNDNISIVVQQLKQQISKQIGLAIWQKSYHDHIIRGEYDYQKIWNYIDVNPMQWEKDCFFIE